MSFCNTCYRTVTMYEGRVEKGLQYETGKKPIKWEEHREVNCVPCDLYAAVKRGGRKRKIARKGKEKTIGIWTDDKIPQIESSEFPFIEKLDIIKLKFYNVSYEKCVCYLQWFN